MSKNFKNWAAGAAVSAIVLPIVLQWPLSFVIEDISYLETWGILSISMVLKQGLELMLDEKDGSEKE